ncbi:hypothetical protein Tco_1045814 [Tanacetum coccineum]|uniref:Uncharacterized protein n=1 Tax=Tanacetum coccineum TaxID=301880 RepID=A0ABQ5GUC5_9ASTR
MVKWWWFLVSSVVVATRWVRRRGAAVVLDEDGGARCGGGVVAAKVVKVVRSMYSFKACAEVVVAVAVNLVDVSPKKVMTLSTSQCKRETLLGRAKTRQLHAEFTGQSNLLGPLNMTGGLWNLEQKCIAVNDLEETLFGYGLKAIENKNWNHGADWNLCLNGSDWLLLLWGDLRNGDHSMSRQIKVLYTSASEVEGPEQCKGTSWMMEEPKTQNGWGERITNGNYVTSFA